MKKIAFASALLAVVALPVWAATGTPAKPAVPSAHQSKPGAAQLQQVDPFQGQSNEYEQLQQEAQIAQIKAKISSNQYQAARYAIQMQKLRAQMAGGLSGNGSSENAKLKKQMQGLEQKVAMLMNHQHKQAKDPHPVHTAAHHGGHHDKVKLLAVLNQGHSQPMAVIDYKGHSQTVTQGQRLGPWRVRDIDGHAATLAGRHSRVLHLQEASGHMAMPTTVSYTSGSGGSNGAGGSGTGAPSITGSLRQQAQQMAQQYHQNGGASPSFNPGQPTH